MLVGVATAYDLGNHAPVKTPQSYPENIPDPARQGGDTIETALVIPSLPYADAGTTAGYANDYDEICPYSNSTAPDVVYSFVASATQAITIDLCGSNYDTKLYVYDAGMALIACNDDFYFGAPCGTYVLAIEEFAPCVVECRFGELENEPALVPDYVDDWNGGCNTDPDFPFQHIVADDNGQWEFCGTSGWYTFQGSPYRDTDWFILCMGPGGEIGYDYIIWFVGLDPATIATEPTTWGTVKALYE